LYRCTIASQRNLNTKRQGKKYKGLLAVLERGGVIGGSSAGATIQGDYLVRGARAKATRL